MLPPSSNCANIRAWAEDLGQERVRLANHLREQLRRYYPQALEVSDDVASEWFLALWKKAPTPEKARRIRTNTVAKLLKTHRIRKIDAPEVLRLLRQKPLTVAPGTIAAACAHIGSLAERLRLVNRQVKQARSRIDGLCRHIADQQDSASGQKSEQRDVDILLSMPGIGRTVLATLLAEASTPLRERNYQACAPCPAPPPLPAGAANAVSSSCVRPATFGCEPPFTTGPASPSNTIPSAANAMPPLARLRQLGTLGGDNTLIFSDQTLKGRHYTGRPGGPQT